MKWLKTKRMANQWHHAFVQRERIAQRTKLLIGATPSMAKLDLPIT